MKAFAVVFFIAVLLSLAVASLFVDDYWQAHYLCRGVCIKQGAFVFALTLLSAFLVALFFTSFLASITSIFRITSGTTMGTTTVSVYGVVFILTLAVTLLFFIPLQAHISSHPFSSLYAILVVLLLIVPSVSRILRGVRP